MLTMLKLIVNCTSRSKQEESGSQKDCKSSKIMPSNSECVILYMRMRSGRSSLTFKSNKNDVHGPR